MLKSKSTQLQHLLGPMVPLSGLVDHKLKYGLLLLGVRQTQWGRVALEKHLQLGPVVQLQQGPR